MSRRILIILGQPSTNSLCAALASTYADAARHAGAEVRLLELGEMQFDPILHHGYEHSQPLEADLQALRSRCDGADATCHIIEALHARADAQPVGAIAMPSQGKRHV